ncbi:hypothetical protein BCR33DRAFT_711866 [Rhizoclosmatium globosum]|uniref:Uncharacterized protein n=1 Tax=Rhizoclosmatium globosum TaxID=329046 RepID=A0A1Y2D0E5_9FUNG|nr:hypothetical protein BCR33DRAFT_711866 [Rhizoclosmatium globosum]|eukprot:ORY52594.1 hypothetical protein BCR33DRAFT_711866 [Rhizoclosmatium globosum]
MEYSAILHSAQKNQLNVNGNNQTKLEHPGICYINDVNNHFDSNYLNPQVSFSAQSSTPSELDHLSSRNPPLIPDHLVQKRKEGELTILKSNRRSEVEVALVLVKSKSSTVL